jgi:hypothetical protein
MLLIFLLLILLSPRVVILLLAFLTNFFAVAGVGLLALLLGFIFAPFTLLWYAVVMNSFGGHWGLLQILVLVLALMADFGGPYGYHRHYIVVDEVPEP